MTMMIDADDVPKVEREAYRKGHRDGYNAGRRVRFRYTRQPVHTPDTLAELVTDLFELLGMWNSARDRSRAAIPVRLGINDYLKAYELAEHADRLMLVAQYLSDVLARHKLTRMEKVGRGG